MSAISRLFSDPHVQVNFIEPDFNNQTNAELNSRNFLCNVDSPRWCQAKPHVPSVAPAVVSSPRPGDSGLVLPSTG